MYGTGTMADYHRITRVLEMLPVSQAQNDMRDACMNIAGKHGAAEASDILYASLVGYLWEAAPADIEALKIALKKEDIKEGGNIDNLLNAVQRKDLRDCCPLLMDIITEAVYSRFQAGPKHRPMPYTMPEHPTFQ